MGGKRMKRTAKKMLLAVLMFCMLFSVPAMAKTPSKTTVKKAYQTYIRKNLSNRYKYNYPKVKYFDINKDGINEMIYMYEAGVRYAVQVYTYRNNRVVHMSPKRFVGCCSVAQIRGKKYLVILQSNGAVDNMSTAYVVSGTRLKKVVSYRMRAIYKNGIETGRILYTKNGKKCSEREYNAFNAKLKTIR